VPSDIFYYQPAATVFGSEAAWINPAALGRYQVSGFQLIADLQEDSYVKSYGSVVFRRGFTTAMRHIHNPEGDDYNEWLFASGHGFGAGSKLNIGLSYRYFKEGPDYFNNRHFWTLAFLTRPSGPFSLGAVLSNMNRGRVDGQRTAVEHRYSLGYRPLGRNLTLACDMFLSSRNSLRQAEFVYHAEYIPRPGLFINASVDSDRNFQVGVRANLLKYFTGSRTVIDRDGHHSRSTVFAGSIDRRQPSLIPEKRRRLAVTIRGNPSENPPQPVFGFKRTPFLSLVTAIYRAAEDPNISAMSIDLRDFGPGFGKAQEIRQALEYFKNSDKKIAAHMSSPTNIAYYVASIADSIRIPPVSQLRLVGLKAELTFWAGTMDKLGVEAEILRIGDYKTAAEKYTRSESTEENREQVNALLDNLYTQFVQGIAEGRGLSTDSVMRIIDNGPFTSEEALSYGLVDDLDYSDKETEDSCTCRSYLPWVSFQRYLSDTVLNDSWQPVPTVAVIVADGEIVPDGGGTNLLGSSKSVKPSAVSRALSQAYSDKSVKATVLRIDSPGGDALAGEEIYRSLTGYFKKEPLVVSMGNVAASGGYYVATPGSHIFVNPATVTGSIGIFGGKVDLSRLYEKIDLGKELYARGKYAGMLTTTRPFTEDERRKYYSHIEAFYNHFVDLVAESRDLPRDSIDQLGQGRVWTGEQALGNGLADELGGLKQAIDYAASEAGLDEYRIEIFPKRRPWFILPRLPLLGGLISMLTGSDDREKATMTGLPLSEKGSLFARLPYDIQIE